jgi:hypothetical protein
MMILLEQDTVLANFEEGFRIAWTAVHADSPPVADPD